MSFNSFAFAAFLPIAWMAYWLLARHRRVQNVLIVIASCVFYGWHDPWLIVLLMAMALWGFLWNPKGKLSLAVAIAGACAPLVYFNYTSQTILVAVGLSFSVFQTISYLVDVYAGRVERVRDVTAYFAYMAFFPQLLAGPIERAGNLCAQFMRTRTFDRPLATLGCRQFLWGLFVKCVIADNCAEIADSYLNTIQANGLAYLIGAVLFSVQIYADFSGYSDMALGVSNLFGIRLRRNFAYPYFAANIADFWRRWHISLTSWLRDYIYIPLGGSRCARGRVIFNTLVVFVVSGVWHGCGWTFFAWGFLHGLFFIPLLLGWGFVKNSRILMIAMVVVGWAFFRAPDLQSAWMWLTGWTNFTSWMLPIEFGDHFGGTVGIIPFFFLIEWFNRNEAFGCARLPSNVILRWVIYFLLVAGIVFGAPGSQSFVYYQF